MLIDARNLSEKHVHNCDVCVIGAGAAGITLALELARGKLEVALLESGGFEPDTATQDLYKGESVGITYSPLDESRLRYFGGTTNIWQGRCRPLDEMDFERRSWVPNSGWPLSKCDLDPYYERAHEICKLGPYNYDARYWGEMNNGESIGFKSTTLENIIFQFSSRPSFKDNYREDILKAENISTLIHANVIDILTDEHANRVLRVMAQSLSGPRFPVEAKYYILATGGIENARLLLASNNVQSHGLGNQNDLVGRYFMDHPFVARGMLIPSDPFLSFGFYTRHNARGVSIHPAFAPSAAAQRKHQLLNIMASPVPHGFGSRGFDDGILEKQGISTVQEFFDHVVSVDHTPKFRDHVRNVLLGWESSVASTKRLTSVKDLIANFRFVFHAEPLPNPASRVTLTNDRDELGVRRVRLDWRLSATDKSNMRRTLEIVGKEFARAGLGRLVIGMSKDYESWTKTPSPDAPWGAFHHMGTTRMATDPKQGVVDANCGIHGLANLFVAGSSVFPTSGHANPTLTIVALAIRLARHIEKLSS